MLQQHVSSNKGASGKEHFPLPLFYHDPLVEFQCLLKLNLSLQCPICITRTLWSTEGCQLLD